MYIDRDTYIYIHIYITAPVPRPQLGATHVLRDNSKLAEFLEALGSEMVRPIEKIAAICIVLYV